MNKLKYIKIVPWILMVLSAIMFTVSAINVGIFGMVFWGLIFVFGGVKGLGYCDKFIEVTERKIAEFKAMIEKEKKLEKDIIAKNKKLKQECEEIERVLKEEARKQREDLERKRKKIEDKLKKSGVDIDMDGFGSVKLSYGRDENNLKGVTFKKKVKKNKTLKSPYDMMDEALDDMDKHFNQMDDTFAKMDKTFEKADATMDKSMDGVDEMMKELNRLLNDKDVSKNASLNDLLRKINKKS